jgi:hypothetical protein
VLRSRIDHFISAAAGRLRVCGMRMAPLRGAVVHLSCMVCICLAFAALAAGAEPAMPPLDSDITVRVSKAGDDVILEGGFVVAASQREVWAVMVDYDRMPEFLENIHESRILQRVGNKIILFQRGTAYLGPFSSTIESTRQVDLVPMREIRSHVIGGDIKKSTGVVVLEPGLTETRVSYYNETTPHINLPFIITRPSLEGQARRQLELMRNEILRRKILARDRADIQP